MVEKDKDTDSSKAKIKVKADSREIVVPGETIVSGEQYLPGEGVYRDGEDIVAARFGLADVSDKLIKIIPLSGVYIPRRGNVVIGTVTDIIGKGWLLDIGATDNAFLNVAEVPRYINQNEMPEHFNFGDSVVGKIFSIGGRGIDIFVKNRGHGRLDDGLLIKINPNKVPRVIGKEGSMVNVIKDATGCNITVGQNGVVWIKGESIDDEVKTKKIIKFICDNSAINGLTEKVEDFVKTMDKGK